MDFEIRISISAREKKLLPLHYIHIGSVPPSTYSKDNEDIYSGENVAGCEVSHSHPSSSEVLYARNLSSWCGR